jgi:hypothetical protein
MLAAMVPRDPIPLRADWNAQRDGAVRSLVNEVLKQARGRLGVEGTFTRAAVSPATIGSMPALAQATQALLSTLTPYSAAADLLERGLTLDFDRAASISLPSIALGSATFVKEGQPIPARQLLTSAGQTLRPFKLATICSLSGEMIRSSNAEVLVKQTLIDSVGPSLDAALFSTATEVPETSPAGILHNITPLTPVGAGVKSEAMADDLVKLVGAVSVVSNKSSIVIITNAAQATAIGLRSAGSFLHAILPSNTVPPARVIVVAANAIASAAEGSPEIQTSKEAAYHEFDPAQPLVDIGGVVAAPIRSLTQTDSVGLKLRWPVSWVVRDPRGVAYMDSVVW